MAAPKITYEHGHVDVEIEILRSRLKRATERRDREPASSPDWDAAMEEISELTERLAALMVNARPSGDKLAISG